MSKAEVYLTEDQIKSLKKLMNQSELGFHLLFDNQTIHDAFKNPFSEDDFFEIQNIKKIQSELLKLLQLKSIVDKQEFIRCLNEDKKFQLIRAYFYMIENKIQNSNTLKH